MKFKIESWKLEKLLNLYEAKKLNLNPPYQRNPIWTIKAQRQLIDSLIQGFPLPTFFVYKKNATSYEMVDGQQRTRALLAYKNTKELDDPSDDKSYKKRDFLNYMLAVTVIEVVEPGEYIEEFYDRVNSKGLRLNRPETIKAKYSRTIFLDLVEKLSTLSDFSSLELVPVTSQKRMLDRDLTEELVALILFGPTDKKNQVDKIYEVDIKKPTAAKAAIEFKKILKHLNRFNKIKALKDTRYRQRNDIYTLFGFIKEHISVSNSILDYFYKLLLLIEGEIKPSKVGCPPFCNYAFACVSQSNSTSARNERLTILNQFLTNEESLPNSIQKSILEYYDLNESNLVKKGKYLTFNLKDLEKAIKLKQNLVTELD